MSGFYSVAVGLVLFVLMIGPALLIIFGALEIYKKTQKSGALYIVFGAGFLALASLDVVANLIFSLSFDIQFYRQVLIYKSYVVLALRNIGMILIGIGIFVHAGELRDLLKD